MCVCARACVYVHVGVGVGVCTRARACAVYMAVDCRACGLGRVSGWLAGWLAVGGEWVMRGCVRARACVLVRGGVGLESGYKVVHGDWPIAPEGVGG